ncbi:MAG: hypothetical protein ACKOXT_06535 [Actinomycetota bacterium]
MSEQKEIPFPKACDLYVPGHTVHFIQAIRKADAERLPAGVRVKDKNAIELRFSDECLIAYNHEVPRIGAAIAKYGSHSVSYAPSSSLLYVKSSEQSTLVFFLAFTKPDECLKYNRTLNF